MKQRVEKPVALAASKALKVDGGGFDKQGLA
jgi:hypothetical protein